MDLSPESAAVVRTTAGAVAEHADEITTLFYRRMFSAHSELLDVFNRANQAIGDQPKALAASVVGFAVQLIDPDAPDFAPVMRRIAHKHVSLGIRARQYAIVGRHLLSAVSEVLGDAVTPQVRAAWDEVYWLFGCSLIAEEARLYAEGGTDPRAPWRTYCVVERLDDAQDVISLILRPTAGPVPRHRTGQYIAVAVELPDGSRQPRQYTISSAPDGDALRITVKRVRGENGAPDGQVSTWLHENARVGTVLDVSQPAGDVVLDESDAPLVLVSAGIGITPVAAILEDVSRHQPDRTVRSYHSDRSHDTHPLYAALREPMLAMRNARTQNWYQVGAEQAPTSPRALSGRMDLTDVDVPMGAAVFMCGPLPFMRAARATLLARAVPAERIHYEVSGPDLWAQQPESYAA